MNQIKSSLKLPSDTSLIKVRKSPVVVVFGSEKPHQRTLTVLR
ncbi:MAG: hypothetical protein WCE92_09270 [Nitrososphaeraceae archaeon]